MGFTGYVRRGREWDVGANPGCRSGVGCGRRWQHTKCCRERERESHMMEKRRIERGERKGIQKRAYNAQMGTIQSIQLPLLLLLYDTSDKLGLRTIMELQIFY